jgi:HK97 family phage prohead protease
MMEMVSPRTFKRLNLARGASGSVIRRANAPAVGVRKAIVEPVDILDERTLRFTLSTGAIDRDRDILAPQGWRLDNYRKNPVVLWGHQAQLLPIGKALEVAGDDTRLRAVVRFLPAEDYGDAGSFADTVYRLAKDGWLAGASVGFVPLRWDFTSDPIRGGDDWFPGIDYHEQELVEFSLVTVPSNPEALIEPPFEPLAAPDPAAVTLPAAAALAAERAKRRRVLAAVEATGRR